MTNLALKGFETRQAALNWWRGLNEERQRELAKKHKSWWAFEAVTRSTSTIVHIYQEEILNG